jgi:adenylosuccinate synthase
MPISIIVGAQYGSEGKGKTAHFVARSENASAVVRVGGPNSGHTVYDASGRKFIFQQLPTAAILAEPICVLSAGSYVDVERLFQEIEFARFDVSRLKVDPQAVVITDAHRQRERDRHLNAAIGSTQTGTGAAVVDRVERLPKLLFAKDIDALRPFLADSKEFLSRELEFGRRIVIEGTQGFGLSPIHGGHYPYATSRDTTAAGFLAEVGLSPLAVDDIVLVARAFPIRVPGNSGPLPSEIDWDTVTNESRASTRLEEVTSVTKNVRRVARFDAEVVKAAIRSNMPTRLVLNHVDYFDKRENAESISRAMETQIASIEKNIGRCVDLIGTSGTHLLQRRSSLAFRTA